MLVEASTKQTYIGKRMLRKEDMPLIQGRARFVDDITPPGCAYVYFLRSPYPHAQISDIDTSKALSLPGVFDVVTYDDILGKVDEPPLPQFPNIKKVKLRSLARVKVRYVGEPIAAVLASDRYVAEDAVEQINVTYKALEPISNAEQALVETKNIVNEEWSSNVAGQINYTTGDVEQTFRDADLVLEKKFVVQRHAATPIEARGLVASYEFSTGDLTVWSSTHAPHILRSELCGALNMEESKIRVISPNIGGSYGLKTPPYPEDILIPLLSILYRRPVKWIETRSENFLAANHARQQTHILKLDKEEASPW